MPQLRPGYDEAIIVVVGTFNPSIFQPEWFRKHEFLTEVDAEAATNSPDLVLANDVAQVITPWLRWQALRRKLDVRTHDPSRFQDIRDLVVSVLELLEHTPVTGLGINRSLHFQMPTREAANLVGDRLGPKAPWSGTIKEPGLLSLQMRGHNPDGIGSSYIVTLSVSSRLPAPAIAIDTNAHYDLTLPGAVAALKNDFDLAMHGAMTAANQLLEVA